MYITSGVNKGQRLLAKDIHRFHNPTIRIVTVDLVDIGGSIRATSSTCMLVIRLGWTSKRFMPVPSTGKAFESFTRIGTLSRLVSSITTIVTSYFRWNIMCRGKWHIPGFDVPSFAHPLIQLQFNFEFGDGRCTMKHTFVNHCIWNSTNDVVHQLVIRDTSLHCQFAHSIQVLQQRFVSLLKIGGEQSVDI